MKAVALALLVVSVTWPADLGVASCPGKMPQGQPCPTEPWETVELEHGDRVARLKRLGKGNRGFEFREDVVRQGEHGLPQYPVDIPVLRVIANQDVFFDSGSHEIRREARPMLEIIAESLRREPPDSALFVAGHTDWDGADDYNIALGHERAAAVSKALVVLGVNQANIHRVSFGEHMPIADNTTRQGKARNRRVEFLFAAKAQAIVPYIVRQHIEFCSARSGEAAESCRKSLVFEIEQVEISMGYEKEVIEIQRESREIDIAEARGASPIEIERRRQDLEFRRDSIPIDISSDKIYIRFGEQ